ncbi:hypothetical protein [Microtetraspora sp. NBRC 16547]|uniref:McrC family protein n=1 Tax=Microtetraspora sp. NBRC 16547 TaxID=3030993 RepID=UPI0024A28AE2|nr:hypothetical protein [Microtetraspora sp. NBRC 16547]GLX03044.1 IQ calmodulin-binding- domain protein [Microtetraspora sp. NBRC 16547]
MTPVVVDEYQTVKVSGLNPSASDRELSESEELNKRIELRWLADGALEVTATSHVGVVALDCVTIHVRPKLVGRELSVLRMLDYASGLSALRYVDPLRHLPDAGHNLRDLICLLLIIECEALLRGGLRRDYVHREEPLPAVRGRLLADRQMLRRFGRLDRLECRFDEFEADILDNQLCAAALQLAARTVGDDAIRRRAWRAAADFSEMCTAHGVDARWAEQRLTYHRHNEHYRQAHRWALLLLQSGGLDNLYSAGGSAARTFLLDMNALFEAFATRLLSEAFHGTGVAVRAQQPLCGAVRHGDGRSYTTITPDIQLVQGHGPGAWRRSVDAKYKLYTDRKIKPEDLYQSFSYAHALSASHVATTPTAYIVFASDRELPSDHVVLRRFDGSPVARITAVGLNLPGILGALGGPGLSPMLRTLRDQFGGIYPLQDDASRQGEIPLRPETS